MSTKSRNTVIRIALLVVLALVVCLISGCSQKNEPAATATPEVTAAPTEAPAEEATEAPTEEPTEAPTEEPTEAPAEEPTEAPTEEPTEAPTEEPTEAPTEAPAEEPTDAPAAETLNNASAEATEVPAEEATEAPAEEPTVAPRVLLATVNGEEIWSDNGNLNYAYEQYVYAAQNYGMDPTEESTVGIIRSYSMLNAVQTALIYQKAAELGLDTVTDEDKAEMTATAKEQWEEIIQQIIADQGVITEESTDEEKAAARADAEALLLTYGYNEEIYVSAYIDDATNVLVENRVRASLMNGKTVSDEEVEAYYNDLVQEDKEAYEGQAAAYEFYTNYYGQPSYYIPEGFRSVLHILLPVDETLLNDWKDLSARLEEQKSAEETEPTETEEAAPAETPAADAEATAEPTVEPTAEPVTEEMVKAAEQAILDSVKSTVDEIKAKLEAGTSFEDLIKEYGTDPGMQSEDGLANGYLIHNDSIMYDSSFKEAAMALEKIGDVSEPVVGQYGVHIIQYLKDIQGGPVELTDELKEQFRATLQAEMENEVLQNALSEWVAAATIEYTAEGEAWRIPEEEPAEETASEEAATPTDAAAVEDAATPTDATPAK